MLDRRAVNPFRTGDEPDIFGLLGAQAPAAPAYPAIPNPWAAPPESADYSAEAAPQPTPDWYQTAAGRLLGALNPLQVFGIGPSAPPQPTTHWQPWEQYAPGEAPQDVADVLTRILQNVPFTPEVFGVGQPSPRRAAVPARAGAPAPEALARAETLPKEVPALPTEVPALAGLDKQITALEDELGAMQRTAAGKTLAEQTPAEAATLRRKSAQLTELRQQRELAAGGAQPPAEPPAAPPGTPPPEPQPPPEPPVAPPEAPGTVASATARLEELQRQRARFGNIVDAQGNPIYGATGERPPSAVAETVGTRQLSRSLGAFPEDVQAALRAQGEALRPAVERRTGALSWDESAALADQVYQTAIQNAQNLPVRGELVQTIARWEEDLDARIAAGKDVARAIVEGRATAKDRLEGLVALREAAALRVRGEGGVSEVGRALNYLRRGVQEAARNPSDAAWNAALRKATRLPQAEVDKFFGQVLALGDDPVRMRAFLSDIADVPLGRKIVEYVQGNVLWDVATHLVNVSSGFLQQGSFLAQQLGEDPVYFPMVLHSWMGGYKHAMNRIVERYSELGALKGMRRWEETMGSGAEALLGIGGPGRIEMMGVRAIKATPGEPLGVRGAAATVLGNLSRTPRLALGAEDLFQTVPMFDAKLRLLAEQAAEADPRLGAMPLWAPERRAFVQQYLVAPPKEAKLAAFADAEEWALHGTNEVSRALVKAREKIAGFAGGAFSPFMLPLLFINTPLMLAKIGTRMIPGVGLAFARGRPFREVLAEQAIGSSVMTEMTMLLAQGDMTASTPKSKTEADEWQAQGKGPLRIRASEYPIWGNVFRAFFAAQGMDATQQWMPASWLGPFVLPATLAAVAFQVHRDRGTVPLPEQLLAIAGTTGKAVIQQLPLLQGMNMLQQMLDNPLANAERIASRIMQTYVPEETLQAMVERMTDDYQRDPSGIAESIQAVIPYLAQGVRTRVDVLGRDVQRRGFLRETPEQPHPLLEESARLRAAVAEGDFGGLPKWSDKLGTDPVSGKVIQLSPDEAHEYSKLAGGNRDRLLTALVGMPEYQQLPVREQAKAFDQTRQQADEMARRWLGLSLAGKLASTDTTGTLRAWQLSMAGAGKLIERAQIARQWTDAGLMSGDLKRSVDASRTYVDPTAKNYQLSVDEQVKGLALIDHWRAAPAFITGNAAEWQTAAQLARDYNDVRDYLERVASRNGKKVTAMPEYQGLLRYYQSGPRDATGTPILAKYYTPAGSIRDGLVSAERRSIAREPIWGHFSAYAEPAPDNPYRFAHPLPNVPGVTPPPSSGAGLVPFSPERPDLLVPP